MSTTETEVPQQKPVKELERVVIRFAGDSGDGMQLTGDRFTTASAVFGNDVSTFPDYPAEIRAPAGTVAGVSSFQIHFADYDILTPGDQPSVLVAMNPAALKKNLADLVRGGSLIVNSDAFTDSNLKKAGYEANPLDDDALRDAYQLVEVPLTSLTLEALKEYPITKKEAERAKNMFALGIVSWMYHRPPEPTIEWITKKFAKR
ncbi:MAG: 2-oxoacid:acceptor oxidoreductase family protein, partial [Actinomycetota bacterium]